MTQNMEKMYLDSEKMALIYLIKLDISYLSKQINSVWQTSVNDRIVVQWTAQGECVCSNQRSGVRDTCPFNVSVPIPSCNVQLRRCVTEMFKKTLEPRERLFWSKYSSMSDYIYITSKNIII